MVLAAEALDPTIVAFCGAGGTGKTTTLEAFIQRHPEYNIIRSQSRRVFEEKGVFTEDAQDRLPPEAKWDLQKAIQEAHWEHMQQFIGTKAIAERTQIDQLAYALQYCYKVIGIYECNWLNQLVKNAMQHYKAIFYFPLVEFPGTADGMRTAHFGKRLQYDLLLQGLLKQFDVRAITVPPASIEKRVEFIEGCLETQK